MSVVIHCPACGHKMDVITLKCPVCGTGVTGRFEMDEIFNISEEQMKFVKVFLKNRGNLSEVQKELGISYPTARNRLNDIVKALGYDVADEEKINEREILEKVKNGEIDAAAAISILKGEKKNEGNQEF